MGFFDFLKKKAAPAEADETFDEFAARLQADFAKNDYLGKAAVAGSKAQEAVASGEFDIAWGLYHDQKQHYLQHASRCGFTKAQVLALDASVSQPMANILRLENKHYDALVHIVYWLAASSTDHKVAAAKASCVLQSLSIQDSDTF